MPAKEMIITYTVKFGGKEISRHTFYLIPKLTKHYKQKLSMTSE